MKINRIAPTLVHKLWHTILNFLFCVFKNINCQWSTGEKLFLSNYCDKVSKCSLYFNCHMAINTGEKPYYTRNCDRELNRVIYGLINPTRAHGAWWASINLMTNPCNIFEIHTSEKLLLCAIHMFQLQVIQDPDWVETILINIFWSNKEECECNCKHYIETYKWKAMHVYFLWWGFWTE